MRIVSCSGPPCNAHRIDSPRTRGQPSVHAGNSGWTTACGPLLWLSLMLIKSQKFIFKRSFFGLVSFSISSTRYKYLVIQMLLIVHVFEGSERAVLCKQGPRHFLDSHRYSPAPKQNKTPSCLLVFMSGNRAQQARPRRPPCSRLRLSLSTTPLIVDSSALGSKLGEQVTVTSVSVSV